MIDQHRKGSLDVIGHTVTFRCFCGEQVTIPSWGDQRTHHKCGRTWWWSDVNTVTVQEPES